MTDDAARQKPTTEEPALTQKNTLTIRGEETLAERGTVESHAAGATGERAKAGVMPTSYGAAGGTTDATEEGGDGTGI